MNNYEVVDLRDNPSVDDYEDISNSFFCNHYKMFALFRPVRYLPCSDVMKDYDEAMKWFKTNTVYACALLDRTKKRDFDYSYLQSKYFIVAYEYNNTVYWTIFLETSGDYGQLDSKQFKFINMLYKHFEIFISTQYESAQITYVHFTPSYSHEYYKGIMDYVTNTQHYGRGNEHLMIYDSSVEISPSRVGSESTGVTYVYKEKEVDDLLMKCLHDAVDGFHKTDAYTVDEILEWYKANNRLDKTLYAYVSQSDTKNCAHLIGVEYIENSDDSKLHDGYYITIFFASERKKNIFRRLILDILTKIDKQHDTRTPWSDLPIFIESKRYKLSDIYTAEFASSVIEYHKFI